MGLQVLGLNFEETNSIKCVFPIVMKLKFKEYPTARNPEIVEINKLYEKVCARF